MNDTQNDQEQTPDQPGDEAPESDDRSDAADPFVEGQVRASDPDDEGSLIVDLDGYEGPLDVLLQLARHQKVDLAKISILALAEQYITFIHQARQMHLEIAADYLVMASWLAYLKSRLLLPPPDEEEGPSGEEMAARLAFQLQRLNAMRESARKIMARHQMGVHVRPRGAPEGIRLVKTSTYTASFYDLLKAYSEERIRGHIPVWEPKQLPIMAIEMARKRLESMFGVMVDWGKIDSLLPTDFQGPMRRTAMASTFSATLELVRDGHLEVRQSGEFGPVYVRRRDTSGDNESGDNGSGDNGSAGEGGASSGL